MSLRLFPDTSRRSNLGIPEGFNNLKRPPKAFGNLPSNFQPALQSVRDKIAQRNNLVKLQQDEAFKKRLEELRRRIQSGQFGPQSTVPQLRNTADKLDTLSAGLNRIPTR